MARSWPRPLLGCCRAGTSRRLPGRPKVACLVAAPGLAAHVEARLRAKDSPTSIAVELSAGVYADVDGSVSREMINRVAYDHGRRVRTLGAQGELFPTWQHFPFAINRSDELAIVEAEPRQHARHPRPQRPSTRALPLGSVSRQRRLDGDSRARAQPAALDGSAQTRRPHDPWGTHHSNDQNTDDRDRGLGRAWINGGRCWTHHLGADQGLHNPGSGYGDRFGQQPCHRSVGSDRPQGRHQRDRRKGCRCTRVRRR